MMKDAVKTIGNLISKSSNSFIGSIDKDKFPNIKCMLTPRKIEGIKYFYFSTNTSSQHVKQYKKNNKACIYFYDRRFFRGVIIKGIMEVLEDSENKKMIWQETDTMYYKLGVTDPDYCVLKFTASSGRYYSNFKSEDFLIE